MPPFTRRIPYDDARSFTRVLMQCRRLVADSADSHWAGMDVAEILGSLDKALADVADRRRPNIGDLTVLFAPTGPLQETSIDSGWGDEFLKLSSEFDRLAGRD